MTSLESDLTQLPEPTMPEGLAAGVTARIARIESDLVQAPPVTAADTRRDRLAWTTALAGLAVSLGAQLYGFAIGETTLDLMSLRTVGMDGAAGMLPTSPAVGVMVVGLLLYLAGLFAPARSTGRRQPMGSPR